MSSPTGNLVWQELTLRERQALAPAPDELPPLRKSANRGQKAVAACTGAVVTSLLMTPFDVIKTRLQTQSSAEPLFTPSSHLSVSPRLGEPSSSKVKLPPSSRSHAATCCQQTFFTRNAHEQILICKFDPRLAGEGASSASSSRSSQVPLTIRSRQSNPRAPVAHTTAFVNPSGGSVLRHHPSSTCAYPSQSIAAMELEASTRHSRVTGIWDGVLKVSRAEGAKGLWRGLSPTLLMTIPSQVTYMTCYDYFRSLFLAEQSDGHAAPGSGITTQTMLASLVSGALSRSISATLVTPLELVRTRLQASDVSHSLSSIVSSLSAQVRSEGPSVLFRGLSTTLWRDVPFSAIYFMGYESLKRIMTGGSGLGEGNGKGGLEEFSVAFISGATSGSVAAVATHPFDLIKTRLQVQTKSSNRHSGKGSRTISALRSIVRDEGWQGMFRGLSPRVAKVAPACGLMIGSYEAVGTLFALAESD